MRSGTPVAQFERRLVELGCPKAEVTPKVQELADHHEDLRRAALEQGLSETEADARANELLGEPIRLADRAVAELRQSSWWGRHPVVGFCVMPPFAIIVTTIASLALGWGLFRLFFSAEEWRALIEAGAGPELLSGTFHGGYSVVIGLMAAMFSWLARRSVSGLTWALVACGLCSLHSFFFSFGSRPRTSRSVTTCVRTGLGHPFPYWLPLRQFSFRGQ